MLTEAKKFHAYARECLQLAEQASEPDIRNGGRRSVHQLRQHAGPERSRQFRSDLRRRWGGRPIKDIRADPDLIKVEFALALKAAWKISERKAFDLVVAEFESRVVAASRGLVEYETSPARTIAGRARTLRRKVAPTWSPPSRLPSAAANSMPQSACSTASSCSRPWPPPPGDARRYLPE
jgi:hypothetical protein